MPKATPNPVLRRLDALVGVWETRPYVGGQPMGLGHTSFQWMEGGAYLVQHADGEPSDETPAEWAANSPLPSTQIIGLDQGSGTFSCLYADARAVYRVYQMSLADGVWKLWRSGEEGFHQRFTGTFSDDGATITGRWEGSPDGESWEADFDLVYTKSS